MEEERRGVFRRVLVPVEFAPSDDVQAEGGDDWGRIGALSVQALEMAARLTRGGELWVVHAATDLSDFATTLSADATDEVNRRGARRATEALRAVAEKHCSDVELRYLIKPGRPLDVILEAAGEHPPDAIILAASTRTKVYRAFLGSTADKIIRQSSWPVLVLPSGTA